MPATFEDVIPALIASEFLSDEYRAGSAAPQRWLGAVSNLTRPLWSRLRAKLRWLSGGIARDSASGGDLHCNPIGEEDHEAVPGATPEARQACKRARLAR